MTISSFCHDQLRQRGPLTLDALARLAVDAGTTASRTPEASVRNAIAHSAVELPDGRWASPLSLLEGRWLTTRTLGSTSLQYGDVVYPEQDLAPLHCAVRAQELPLATGGALRRATYGDSWRTPKGWPDLECGPDRLYALGLSDGVLHVEVIDETPALRASGHALALALGRLDRQERYWSTGPHTVEANLLTRLWELAAAGSPVLREPAPPLSECVPPLAAALRADWERQAEEELHWRPTLDLPAELREVARDAADSDETRLDAWLNAFVTRSLLAVDTGAMWQPLYDDRVRPLRRRS